MQTTAVRNRMEKANTLRNWILATLIIITFNVGASPLAYDIYLLDGNLSPVASGVFSVDSDALAAAPSTGAYFSPAGAVLSFEVSVNGILFDTIQLSRFATIDGVLTGLQGSTFLSSANPGYELQVNTASALPYMWNVIDPAGANVARGPTYSLSALSQGIPEPTILALMGIGLAGLGFGRKRIQGSV